MNDNVWYLKRKSFFDLANHHLWQEEEISSSTTLYILPIICRLHWNRGFFFIHHFCRHRDVWRNKIQSKKPLEFCKIQNQSRRKLHWWKDEFLHCIPGHFRATHIFVLFTLSKASTKIKSPKSYIACVQGCVKKLKFSNLRTNKMDHTLLYMKICSRKKPPV